MPTYTPFTRKENHLSVVSADDINQLQDAVEKVQELTFTQGDANFLDRSLFSLQNHPDANSMIVDTLEDLGKMNASTFKGIIYNEKTRSLHLAPGERNGTAVTKLLDSGTGKAMRRLTLISEQYRPQGTDIRFSVSYDGLSYYPIRTNEATPLEIDNPKAGLYIRIQMERANEDVDPRLDAWAILYQDETYAFRFLDDGLMIGVESAWDGTITE